MTDDEYFFLTTIKVRNVTRDGLKHIARKDETFDDLLTRLIEQEG